MKPGVYRFTDPYIDELPVRIDSIEVIEEDEQRGMAELAITLIEAGPETPRKPRVSAEVEVAESVARLREDLEQRELYSLEEQINAVVDAARERVGFVVGALREVNGRISSVYDGIMGLENELDEFEGQIEFLLGQPARLAAALMTLIRGVADLVTLPVEDGPVPRHALMVDVFRAGASVDPTPPIFRTTTESRERELAVIRGVNNTTRLSNVAAVSEGMVSVSYTAQADIVRAQSTVMTEIDSLVTEIDDPLIQEDLLTVRESLMRFFAEKRSVLPSTTAVTLIQTMPLLPIVYEYYGDLLLFDDTIERNGIANPNQVLGGTEVELLETS